MKLFQLLPKKLHGFACNQPAIWETNVFCAKHTRMDFLFSLVLSVSPATMRQSPLHLYYTFEQKAKGAEALH